MGMIAFVSAKGAPGVTTTALAVAALWPRPVLLADCDPAGGDVALRLPDPDGSPLDSSRGMLSLLPLARRELSAQVLHEHSQTVLGGMQVVPGLAGPEQAGAVGPLWANLAHAFASVPDADVLVDCGRVHAGSVHLPLLQRSQLVVCVIEPSVTSLVHSRDRLRSLESSLVGPDGRRPRVGVVVVAEPGSRDVDGTRALVERDLPSVEYFGQIAHDSRGAGIFSGRTVSRPDRTLLVRSVRPVVQVLASSTRPLPAPPPSAASAVATDAASGEDSLPVPATADHEPTKRRRFGRRQTVDHPSDAEVSS